MGKFTVDQKCNCIQFESFSFRKPSEDHPLNFPFYVAAICCLKRKLETLPKRYPSNNSDLIVVSLLHGTEIHASLHNRVFP